uniref:Uncharacterized protein n=1 Tax=Ditylenchus dipsaci TaxID=166011 RepID=A0A915ERP2_9BILA
MVSNFRSSSSLSSFRKTLFETNQVDLWPCKSASKSKAGWNIGRSARKPASVPKPPPIGRVDIPEPRAHKHQKGLLLFFAGQSNNQHDKCKILLKRIQEMDLTMQLSDLQRSCSVYDELEQSVVGLRSLTLLVLTLKPILKPTSAFLNIGLPKSNATEQMDCK